MSPVSYGNAFNYNNTMQVWFCVASSFSVVNDEPYGEFLPFRVHYTNKSHMLVNGMKRFGRVSTATLCFILNLSGIEYQSCIGGRDDTGDM